MYEVFLVHVRLHELVGGSVLHRVEGDQVAQLGDTHVPVVVQHFLIEIEAGYLADDEGLAFLGDSWLDLHKVTNLILRV